MHTQAHIHTCTHAGHKSEVPGFYKLPIEKCDLIKKTISFGIKKKKPTILTPKLPAGSRVSSLRLTHGSCISFLFEKTDPVFLQLLIKLFK